MNVDQAQGNHSSSHLVARTAADLIQQRYERGRQVEQIKDCESRLFTSMADDIHKLYCALLITPPQAKWFFRNDAERQRDAIRDEIASAYETAMQLTRNEKAQVKLARTKQRQLRATDKELKVIDRLLNKTFGKTNFVPLHWMDPCEPSFEFRHPLYHSVSIFSTVLWLDAHSRMLGEYAQLMVEYSERKHPDTLPFTIASSIVSLCDKHRGRKEAALEGCITNYLSALVENAGPATASELTWTRQFLASRAQQVAARLRDEAAVAQRKRDEEERQRAEQVQRAEAERQRRAVAEAQRQTALRQQGERAARERDKAERERQRAAAQKVRHEELQKAVEQQKALKQAQAAEAECVRQRRLQTEPIHDRCAQLKEAISRILASPLAASATTNASSTGAVHTMNEADSMETAHWPLVSVSNSSSTTSFASSSRLPTWSSWDVLIPLIEQCLLLESVASAHLQHLFQHHSDREALYECIRHHLKSPQALSSESRNLQVSITFDVLNYDSMGTIDQMCITSSHTFRTEFEQPLEPDLITRGYKFFGERCNSDWMKSTRRGYTLEISGDAVTCDYPYFSFDGLTDISSLCAVRWSYTHDGDSRFALLHEPMNVYACVLLLKDHPLALRQYVDLCTTRDESPCIVSGLIAVLLVHAGVVDREQTKRRLTEQYDWWSRMAGPSEGLSRCKLNMLFELITKLDKPVVLLAGGSATSRGSSKKRGLPIAHRDSTFHNINHTQDDSSSSHRTVHNARTSPRARQKSSMTEGGDVDMLTLYRVERVQK